MNLLNPIIFSAIKNSSYTNLKNIANRFISKYLSPKKALEFCNACKNMDYLTANKILDDTIKIIGNSTSVSSCISNFADKFDFLNINLLKLYTEKEKIKLLDKNSDDILDFINQKMLRRKKWKYLLFVLLSQ